MAFGNIINDAATAIAGSRQKKSGFQRVAVAVATSQGRKSAPARIPVVKRKATPAVKSLGAAIAGYNSNGTPRYVYGPPAPLKTSTGRTVFPHNPVITPQRAGTVGVGSQNASAALLPTPAQRAQVSGNPQTAYGASGSGTVQDIMDRVAVEQKVADKRQKEKARLAAQGTEPGWIESGINQGLNLLGGVGALAVDAGKQVYDLNAAASPAINLAAPQHAQARANAYKNRWWRYANSGIDWYRDAGRAIVTGDTKWLKENYVVLGMQALGAVGGTEAAISNVAKVAGEASRARVVSKLISEENAARAAGDSRAAEKAAGARSAVEQLYLYGKKGMTEEASREASAALSGIDRGINRFQQWARNDTRAGSPRVRPDKEVKLPQKTASSEQPLPQVDSIVIPSTQRPLRSAGVIRRSIQKRVTEPIGEALSSPLNSGTIKLPGGREVALPFSHDRAWNRAAGKVASGIAYTTREAADYAASIVVREMLSPSLSRIKPGSVPDTAAWFLHQGIDPAEAASMWRTHLADMDRKGLKIEAAKRFQIEENIKKAESVDPRLLSDVPPAPNEMNTQFAKDWTRTQNLTRVTQNVADAAGIGAVEAGVMTPGQQQLGSTLGPRVMAGERLLKDALAELSSRERSARAAASEAQAAGNQGRAAYHIDQARTLRRQRQALSERTLYGNHEGYTRAVDAEREARAAVLSAKTTAERDRAVVNLAKAKQNVARARTRARRVTWTQENFNPETAPRSSYVEHHSAVVGGRRPRWLRRNGGGTFAPTPMKRTSGHLLRTGEAAIGNMRASVAGSAESLVRGERVARGAQTFMETFAATRTVNGEKRLVTGHEAVDLANASQGLYTAIDRRMLERVYKVGKREIRSDLEEAILAGDVKDKIAIPTAAYDAWREVMGAKRNGIDAFNQVFKSTVLPFKPGWYFQNFIGNWMQFFLQAGPDLQSLRMGSSKEIQNLLPDRLRVGLVGEAAPNVATRGGNPAAHGMTALLGRLFGLNDKMEKWSKSASYVAAAKGTVRKDPLLGNASHMSDAQLISALKEVADAAGRGEPWANLMIEDAIRTSQDFLGDYSRFNHIERKYMRRIMPFYAWARTITRLALMLPVKYPKRTALLTIALQTASALGGAENIRDIFGMSAVPLFGRLIPTGGDIPSDTLLGMGDAIKNAVVQSSDPFDFVGHMGTETLAYLSQNSNPYLQAPAVIALASTPIGIPLEFTPGLGGINRSSSGRTTRFNPATGSYEEIVPRYGLNGALGWAENQFPPFKMASQLIAGSRRPYANVAPHNVFWWGMTGMDKQDEKQMFAPEPRTGRPLQRDWITTLTGVGLDAPAFKPDWQAGYRRWRQTQRTGRQSAQQSKRNQNRPRG